MSPWDMLNWVTGFHCRIDFFIVTCARRQSSQGALPFWVADVLIRCICCKEFLIRDSEAASTQKTFPATGIGSIELSCPTGCPNKGIETSSHVFEEIFWPALLYEHWQYLKQIQSLKVAFLLISHVMLMHVLQMMKIDGHNFQNTWKRAREHWNTYWKAVSQKYRASSLDSYCLDHLQDLMRKHCQTAKEGHS